MAKQEEWKASSNFEDLLREQTLKHVDTVEVFGPAVAHASTGAIEATIKSTDEVVQEMKKWLREGITPNGTRMLTRECWQWYHDFYQGTKVFDKEEECLPKDALIDYYYWGCPYLSHIGNTTLIMMHAQVNFADGTHMPTDRLTEKTKKMKNLEIKARKRLEVEKRKDEAFVAAAMDPGAHRGHPLRREGIYTKYFWRPFLKQNTVKN